MSYTLRLLTDTATNNPNLAQIITTVVSTVIAAGVIYIAGWIRRGVKKLATEHRWLMETTAENVKVVKRLIKLSERREQRRDRQDRRR